MNLVYSLEQLSTANLPLQVSRTYWGIATVQECSMDKLHRDNGYSCYHDITTYPSRHFLGTAGARCPGAGTGGATLSQCSEIRLVGILKC